MPVLYAPESPESQERTKFEAQYSPWGPPKKPYMFGPYPMMLHMAGPPSKLPGAPVTAMGAITIVDTIVVQSEGEGNVYRERGFRNTPLEALDAYEQMIGQHAELAANLEYQKKNTLSEPAAAEVQRAQDAVSGHLPAVPVTPIAPRRKNQETN